MLTINVSELILTVINFFLLFFLLRRFLYTPLVTFMDARRARIEAGLDQEKEALDAMRDKELLYEAQRKESLEEAKRILGEAKAADERRHVQWIADAKAQSVQNRKTAEDAAAERSSEEKRQLENHRDQLAALLAERLLCSEPLAER